jgi:hypothetical protein
VCLLWNWVILPQTFSGRVLIWNSSLRIVRSVCSPTQRIWNWNKITMAQLGGKHLSLHFFKPIQLNLYLRRLRERLVEGLRAASVSWVFFGSFAKTRAQSRARSCWSSACESVFSNSSAIQCARARYGAGMIPGDRPVRQILHRCISMKASARRVRA